MNDSLEKGENSSKGKSSFGKLSHRGLGVQVNLFGYFYRVVKKLCVKKRIKKSQSRERLKVYLGRKKFICFVEAKKERKNSSLSKCSENLEEKDLPCRSDDKINIKLKY